ncbi:MAG: oxidoreductase [bacterium]|nr:oxidoreductase [bacterium]
MLADQNILVTGGCGLLGKEFGKALALAGARVILADVLSPEAGEKIAQGLGEAVFYRQMDITDKAQIEGVFKECQSTFGGIRGLVNNAYPRNKNYGRQFFEVEYADFCENLSLNLGGYFLTSQVAAKFFKEQGGGNIVNISSIYGVIAPHFQVYEGTKMSMPVEYAAIKAGLLHLTKYMAAYLKDTGVRVNAISPGGILDQQPEPFLSQYKKFCSSKGMLDPADITGALVFLLSPASQYMNGQNLVVDDGFTL